MMKKICLGLCRKGTSQKTGEPFFEVNYIDSDGRAKQNYIPQEDFEEIIKQGIEPFTVCMGEKYIGEYDRVYLARVQKINKDK